ADREEGDLDGPVDLAVWAESDSTGAQVIWIGCSNMDDDLLYQSIPGNCDFLVGCAASLSGQSSGILLESKALEADQLVIPARTAAAVGLVFLALVPAGQLLAGADGTERPPSPQRRARPRAQQPRPTAAPAAQRSGAASP